MSYWTHILGVIHADAYKMTDDIKQYVEDALKDAPKITGSEQNASTLVNALPGHSRSTSCDCGRCEYGNTAQYFNDGFECNAPEEFVCPYGQYQTQIVITVQGDLRDRFRQRTKKEWNAFHRYVAKTLRYNIINAICRIDGL